MFVMRQKPLLLVLGRLELPLGVQTNYLNLLVLLNQPERLLYPVGQPRVEKCPYLAYVLGCKKEREPGLYKPLRHLTRGFGVDFAFGRKGADLKLILKIYV